MSTTVSGDSGGTALSNTTSGTVVGRAYGEYLVNTALNTTIPHDDTIPQVGEGTEIISVSITPKSTTNRIRVRFQGMITTASGVDNCTAALFLNGGTNAIAATGITTGAAGYGYSITLDFEHVPGSLSAQTYSIRVGAQTYVAYMNGVNGTRRYGGIARSTLILEELVP